MKKIKKILIVLIVLILTLSLVGIYFVADFFYNLALNPNTPKDMVFNDGGLKKSEVVVNGYTDEDWLKKVSNQKELSITSFDNLKLYGYEVPSKKESNIWVISVHGYNNSSKHMATYARQFNNFGYNVLLPELRGHGKSQGEYVGMGWHDRLDIVNWIDYINKNNKDAEIILHGVSMGAATVMMTSGEKLPGNVKAIIEDCGYTSAWDQFSYHLNNKFNLPDFPILNASDVLAKSRANYSLKDASAINQLAKTNIPMLFIHGDKDDFVPLSMVDTLYKSHNGEKEMLIIEGAGHGKSSQVNPTLYFKTTKNFIEKYTN
ncbi:MAG: alpha/beta hydrolase [Clostridium sp.]